MNGRQRLAGALAVPAGLVLCLATGCGAGGTARSAPGEPAVPGAASAAAAPGGVDTAGAAGDAATGPPRRGSGGGQQRAAGPGEPTVGPHHEQSDVLRRLPGPEDATCVAVGDRRDVRSGGLAAGPFDSIREGYSPAYGDARVVRIYLVPEHAASMTGVVVTAHRVGSADTVRTRESAMAEADAFRFYDVQLAVPRSGTWVIRAVSGSDRGCWTVALG